MQQEFIDHATNVGKVETTAQIVGVVRGDTTFVKPVPPTAVHAFYGADAPQDTLAEQVGAALSQEDHLAMLNQQANAVCQQDESGAANAFFGIDEKSS